MRMHHFRIWRRIEFVLLAISLIIFLTAIFLFGYFSKEVGNALILLGIVYTLTIFGYIYRGKTIRNMSKNAEKLRLKRVGLLKYRETSDVVEYEVHVLLPKTPLATDEDATNRIAKVKRKLILGFVQDIDKLYGFAKQHHDQDVVFFGTSHEVLRKAWNKKWRKYGIDSIEGPCMDPWAAYTKRNWGRVVRKFYGKNVSLPIIPKEEWKTLYTKITKEDVNE